MRRSKRGAIFDAIFQYEIVSDSAPQTHLVESKNLLRYGNFHDFNRDVRGVKTIFC